MAPSSSASSSSGSNSDGTIAVAAQSGPVSRYANSLTGVLDDDIDRALELDIAEAPADNSLDPDDEIRDNDPDLDLVALPVDMIEEAYIGEYKRDPTRQVVPSVPGTAATCTNLRKRYNELLADGMDVFLKAWMRENMGYGILSLALHLDWEPIEQALDMIMVTLDPAIRKAILGGDLPQRARTNRPEFNDLRTALKVHRLQAEEKGRAQPIIYANFLVSEKTGMAPTYAETNVIAQYLTNYTVNNAVALKIDSMADPNFDRAKVRRGFRFFIRTAPPTGQTITTNISPSPERARILGAFSYALTRRLSSEMTDANENEPMPAPLSEWGFTVESAKREQQHRSHSSSNWLMNLTETICKILFPGQYKTKYFPVYCIPFQELAGLAEHFLTVLGQGYVANAGGFSHEPAGRSIKSAERLTRQQSVDVERWVRLHIPVEYNVERLHRSMKRRVEKMEGEVAHTDARIEAINKAADEYLEVREKVRVALDENTSRKRDEVEKYKKQLEETEDRVIKLRKAVEQQKADRGD